MEDTIIDFSTLKKRPKRAPPYSDIDQAYFSMLSRILPSLNSSPNPQESHRIPDPEVLLLPHHRTAWLNFRQVSFSLSRNPVHLLQFAISHFSTECCLSPDSQTFVFRGIHTVKSVQKMIEKYVEDYVKCKMCQSWDTELQRETDLRTTTLVCKRCRSVGTVKPIFEGFHQCEKLEKRLLKTTTA